ncbi:MAG: hypothetical protein OXI54_15725 [Chloroflexota bacterium]|nr:hypothetical protein [Chloroflexota bacterium]MDE2685579.1 hypothetical protein [Chloroflexota bacterium]
MTISELRRRVNALKRKFAAELAIIKLRRLAQAVSNDWDPNEPPEPHDVIQRVAKAGFRLSTFMRLRRYLDNTIRQGDVPEPECIVLDLLPWAGKDRYRAFFRCELPPQPSGHPLLPV